MELTGYILAVIVGLTLGLIGGGGSMLALPILVYVFGIDTITATAYSLFIVGITSLVGSSKSILNKNIDLKAAALFAAPSLVSVFLVRKFVIPIIPSEIFTIGSYTLTDDKFLFLLFGVLLVVAGWLMLTGKCLYCDEEVKDKIVINYPFIVAEGVVIGAITGIVGAGGGFLVIPALVMYAGVSMKKAVGTSLLIIAVKSLVGFVGDWMNFQEIDWKLLITFSGLSIIGMFVGSRFSEKVSEKNLRQIFGIVVVFLAVVILIKEIIW